MALKGALVKLIEENADELTRKWKDTVRTHPDMPTYRNYDEGKLYERAFSVYSQLGKWLSDDTTKDDIREIYTKLGSQRRAEGFHLFELLQALIITRRVLWFKIQSEGLLDTALDLNQALDLSNRTIVFFDRAMFYASQGFETGP